MTPDPVTPNPARPAIPGPRTPDRSAGTGAQHDRVHGLVAAHRRVQAEQRCALGAENIKAFAAARRRSDAIVDALDRCGATAIVELLIRETDAGLALIVALTCDDSPPGEIAAALGTYPGLRAAVDTALTGPAPNTPAT